MINNLSNIVPSKALTMLDSNKKEVHPILKSKVSKNVTKVKDPVPRYFESVNQLQGYYSEGEFDLNEIFKLLKFESFFLKATQKKLGLLTKSGYQIHSDDDKVKEYFDARFSLMELQTGVSIKQIIEKIAFYLIVCSNAFLIKTRDKNFQFASSYTKNNKEVYPVNGLFLVHPTSLKPRYKFVKFQNDGQIKHRLELVEWLYVNRRGIIVKFDPEDVIHFSLWKEDGMTFGTPEVLPVIDDIKTLRKIEEDIELLIYRDLFPLIHYTVDNPGMIDHVEGMSELDQAKRDMERMVQDGGIATDFRHQIKYIGSQGKHIEARPYLEYFQNRVFTGLGVSAADMGMGDGISGNTAQSMSKQLIDYAKYVQQELTRQFDETILLEMALQSPFGEEVLKHGIRPTLKFEEIDIEWKIRSENHSADQFTKGAITIDELRNPRGLKDLSEEKLKRTFTHLYGDMSGMAAGKSSATKDLIKSSGTTSNVTKSNDSDSFILDSNIGLQMLDTINSLSDQHSLGKKFNIKVATKALYSQVKQNIFKQMENGFTDAIRDIKTSGSVDIESKISSQLNNIYKIVDELCESVTTELCDDISKNTSKAIKRIDSVNKTEQVKAYNLGYSIVALSLGINDFELYHYDDMDTKEKLTISTISEILPKHPNTKTIIRISKIETQDKYQEETNDNNDNIREILIDEQIDQVNKRFDPIEEKLENALLFVKDLSDTISDIQRQSASNNDNSEMFKIMQDSANKQVGSFLDTISELKDQNHQISARYMGAIERILKSIDGISQDNMNSIKAITDSIPKEITLTNAPIEVNIDNPPIDVNLTVQDQQVEPKKIKKSIKIVRDEDGNMLSADVEEIEYEK